MAKTADVLKAIWADPWFVTLPPDGKLIFLWAITNEHSNLAGLYVVAEETIRHETKFSAQRLTKAFELVRPTMGYRPESGTVVVPSRPKYARTKNEPIAKSIIAAIRECVHEDVQSYYINKYAKNAWLGPYIEDLASELGIGEPHRTSPNLPEVHSQSQSQKGTTESNPRVAEWEDWLEHFREVTGKSTSGSAVARKLFNGRRAEGKSVAELKQATVGSHSDPHLRAQGYDRPETILQESKVERYIGLGAKAKPGVHRDPALAKIIGRAA